MIVWRRRLSLLLVLALSACGLLEDTFNPSTGLRHADGVQRGRLHEAAHQHDACDVDHPPVAARDREVCPPYAELCR